MRFLTDNMMKVCTTLVFALLLTGVSYGEPLYDIVEVDLQRPVDIGPTVLQPGHYRFEQVNGRTDPTIFKVTGENMEPTTLTSVGFNAYASGDRAKETQLVLKKIGDTYYLDKIWIQGQEQGYEFPHPDVSKEARGSGSEEQVAGKWSQSSTQAASNQGSAGTGGTASTTQSSSMSGSDTSSMSNQGSGVATQSGTSTDTTQSTTGSTSATGSDSSMSNQGSSTSTTGSDSSMSNQGATTSSQTGTSTGSSQQSMAGSASTTGSQTGSQTSTSAGNASQFEGCIIGPVGGSYMLDVSGKRYVLRGDYDNVRESVGRVVSLWGVSEQGGTASAEPLAIAVERLTPQSEMCDTTTGARLGSGSGSSTTASTGAQSTGGTSATTSGSTSSMSSTGSTSDSTTSSIGTQSGSASQQTDTAAGGQVNALTGCLESSGANAYSIKATDTGNKTDVVPDARIANELANHVGHQVRLVGDWASGSQAQMPQSTSTSSDSTATSSSSSSASSGSQQQFRAERIDVISLSCQ